MDLIVVHVAEMWAGLITGLLCLNLAKNWPVLMKEWRRMESVMEKYEVPNNFRVKLYALMMVVTYFIFRKFNKR